MPKQEQTQGQYSDLSVRLVTAIILGSVALFALWIDNVLFALFLGALAAMMMAEATAVVFQDREATRLVRMCLVVGAAYAGVAAVMWPLAAVFFALSALALAYLADRSFLVAPIVAGFLIICLATISMSVLRHGPGGLLVVLWIVGCVVACDTGGYFAGRAFGGPKLWPAVSPKKTRSGAYGGFVLAAIVSAVFALSLGGHLVLSVILGVLIAVISIAGDLTESSFKRSFGVKDAGKTLPGHGGLLDRFDGLLAAVIAMAFLGLFVDLAWVIGAGHS